MDGIAYGHLDNKRKVGLRVRAIRKARGIQKLELAYTANVSPDYLADIEGGRANVSIEVLGRLIDCLGMTFAAFFDDAAFREPGRLAGRMPNHGPLPSGTASIAEEAALRPNNELVLAAISDNPRVTIAEIAEQTSISKSTVQRVLSDLVRNGIVKRVGAKKNGCWEVTDAPHTSANQAP